MKGPVVLALIVAQLTIAPMAYAEDIPACTHAVSLRYAQPVPCIEGVLLPPVWALEAVRLRTVRLPELEAELELVRETSAATIEAMTAELEIERAYSAEQSRLLDEALAVHRPDPWWKHPGIWITVGVIAGASATIGIANAVR